MRDGFFLTELKIVNRKQNIFELKFMNKEKYTDNKLFSTVVIGSNGSGKSYLLAMVSEIFRAIESKLLNKDFSLRYDYYYVKYYLKGESYTIEIYKKKFSVTKNNEVIKVNELNLPSKVLAVSFMINDKFVFQTDENNPESNYKYLGIRRTSNATWTNSIVRKLSDSLISNINVEFFGKKVKSILKFLGYKPKISLVFEPETKTFFKKGISHQQLVNKIKKINKLDEFRSSQINKFQESDIQNLLLFVNETSKSRNRIHINNKIGLQYTLDFNLFEEGFKLQQDYKIIQQLIDLRILKAPNLIVYKNDEFDFEFASSGEKQFLFTMLSITSKLEQNSLVLIDEPELSFHPNWQMLYINYLKEIFKDYPTCHFILATHSHYIVSDLEEGSSSLLVISSDGLNRSADLIDYSTYAWSAENILYNIFQVRTTRNYYFEMDLRKIVELIREKSNDITAIETLIIKLKQYIFDDLDPMILIIEEAERYVINAKEN